MAKKIRVVKCIFIASIIIILNTINSFAGNVLDNSQASTILSMPIVKILIVGFAGIIIVSLLYNVSQETENYSKGFAEKDEKNEKIENDNYYINEYNKKNKDTSINQEIIDKANEEEKPKYREEYIRESKLDQELLEEITQLYNEENEEKNDIKDVKDLKLEDDIKNDKEEENEELETDKIKEEKDEEEKLKEEPKKTRGRKKAEENKNDNLAEDFLNNLDMTMRKG
jgi:hypothetical protein CRE_24030